MKRKSLLSIVITLCFTIFNMNAQDLENYQWKNRILLLIDSSENTNLLQEQLKQLETEPKALAERDLKIFILTDKVVTAKGKEAKLSATEIISTYDLNDFKGIVLIGKDGGAKMKAPFVVPPKKIFALIDGMPMRRAEMKSSKKN